MKKLFQFAAFAVLCGLPVAAAEIAHLRNGFSIRHERHESADGVTRLYLGPSRSGYVEVPTVDVQSYEHEEDPPLSTASTSADSAASAEAIRQQVANASSAYGVDADFLTSVIRRESGFNPKALSSKGARGLMQLMPETANKLGVIDSFDPAANIDGGTRYLRALLLRYDGDAVKALAAYNAGAHRVDQYKGVPPYRETRAYVASIIRDYNRAKLRGMQLSVRGPSSFGKVVESRPEAKAGN